MTGIIFILESSSSLTAMVVPVSYCLKQIWDPTQENELPIISISQISIVTPSQELELFATPVTFEKKSMFLPFSYVLIHCIRSWYVSEVSCRFGLYCCFLGAFLPLSEWLVCPQQTVCVIKLSLILYISYY